MQITFLEIICIFFLLNGTWNFRFLQQSLRNKSLQMNDYKIDLRLDFIDFNFYQSYSLKNVLLDLYDLLNNYWCLHDTQNQEKVKC